MRLGFGVAFVTAGIAAVAIASTTPAADGSGRCSKAVAIEAAGQLGLSDVSPTPTVYKVLCGALAGAGSRVMVASILGEGNVGMLYWAVFRWSGSDWRLLMKQRQAAVISATGSDIREEVSIYRYGDPRCCPSGGTKSRIWHWNSSRFVAGPWKLKPPYQQGFFKTPSGNIVCYHFVRFSPSKEASVGCGIQSGLVPAPPRRPCQEGGYAGDRVHLNATGRVGVPSCAGDPGALVGESRARVLGYGKTWSGGGIRCTSAVAGVTCRNKDGHGFFLSREKWRRF